MLILLVFCGVLSALFCVFLMRYGRRNARRYSLDMPQRFHAGHVPRLGGIAMMLACTGGWLWMAVAERYLSVPNGIVFPPLMALAWWVVAAIAVAGGAAEDITHSLGARWRLGFTLLAGVAAAWLFELKIVSLGIAAVDWIWVVHPWTAVLLAVFAVAGLPHAFNLIDGYNGLAGMVAIICCFALAYVSLLVGDRQLAAVVLVLAGATAGFLLWNYPRGLIFAGDGGAYLWGVVIAVASVQLVQRHPQVSPWFPALLLIYPVWETVFSIYRKAGARPVTRRGRCVALPPADLPAYRARRVRRRREARRMLMRNNRTSPYLWGFAVLTVVPAVIFWNNTPMLMAFTALFIVSYVFAYVSIIRFKVPRWVRSKF